MPSLSEAQVETATIELLVAAGYERETRSGAESAPFVGRSRAELLQKVFSRLNPDLSSDTVGQVVRTVLHPPHPTLIENNRWLHALLIDGVEVG